MKIKSILLVFTLLVMVVFGTTFSMAVNSITDYTPYELTVKELPVDEMHAKGSALLTFKIDDLPGESGSDTITWYVYIEKKVGDGEWMGIYTYPTVDFIQDHSIGANQYSIETLWIDDYEWDQIATISYRVYVGLEDLIGSNAYSSYSNIASFGLISSPWAVTLLEQAQNLSLIPESLIGADLTKPITREEFCELAVLLYESVTSTTAVPVSPNPFTDTTNPEILKAFTLGITNGMSATTFEPNTLITREQCATMLFRDIFAINPEGDYSITGVKDFPDQKDIAPWAVQATKYMSSVGIVKGDANGYFMPRGITTAQLASGYGMATREAAIVMSVRTFENLN